jgi:hypothetical protein
MKPAMPAARVMQGSRARADVVQRTREHLAADVLAADAGVQRDAEGECDATLRILDQLVHLRQSPAGRAPRAGSRQPYTADVIVPL